MTTLSELALAPPLMLIAPPDAVLAEAGRMHPRPSTASTIQTAEPTATIAWWTEERFLAAAPMSRLRWLLESSGGRAWLLFDPEDEGLTIERVREAVSGAGLTAGESVALASGETGLLVQGPRA